LADEDEPTSEGYSVANIEMKSVEPNVEGTEPNVEGTGTQYVGLKSDTMPTTPSVEKQKHLLNYADIEKHEKLGSGAFGVVWKGNWRKMDVAVKEIKPDRIGSVDMKAFLSEAEIMMNMISHQNVVLMMGVCQEPLCIVTEFCEKGSLESL